MSDQLRFIDPISTQYFRRGTVALECYSHIFGPYPAFLSAFDRPLFFCSLNCERSPF